MSVGIKKPDPEIFKIGIDELKAKKEEAVYVGDHPQKDIEAALSFGMKAIWRDNGQYEAPKKLHGVVRSLAELELLIKNFYSLFKKAS